MKIEEEFYNTVGSEEKSKTCVVICEQLKEDSSKSNKSLIEPLRLTKIWRCFSGQLNLWFSKMIIQAFFTLLKLLILCCGATVTAIDFTYIFATSTMLRGQP